MAASIKRNRKKAIYNHVRTLSTLVVLVVMVVIVIHYPVILFYLVTGFFVLFFTAFLYAALYELMEEIFGGDDEA